MGIALILVLGLIAILATSPMPDVVLQSLPQGYYVNGRDVCAGERIPIAWQVFLGENPRLSSDPPNSTLPELANYSVEAEGSMIITVLSNTVLRLETDRESTLHDDNTLWLKEVPSQVCEQFEASPFGIYEGAIEQTEPSSKSLGRRLIVSYPLDAVVARVSYAGPTPDKRTPDQETDFFSFPGARLVCYQAEEKFVCSNEDRTQVMTGILTADSYVGTFRGIGVEALAGTTGTFELYKRLE